MGQAHGYRIYNIRKICRPCVRPRAWIRPYLRAERFPKVADTGRGAPTADWQCGLCQRPTSNIFLKFPTPQKRIEGSGPIRNFSAMPEICNYDLCSADTGTLQSVGRRCEVWAPHVLCDIQSSEFNSH